MNKKGTHIDWAVSMGIFLVYVLSMFVLIQPGVEKFYKEDNLLNIVEQGLRSPNAATGGAYYNITKLPLRIDVKDNNCPSGKYFSIENPFEIDSSFNNALNIVMLNETGGEEALSTFRYDEATIEFIPHDVLRDDDNPHFMAIYYSPDTFEDHDFTGHQICGDATVTVGSIEQIFGLNPEIIGEYLSCSSRGEYEDLKKLWKFPAGKEFSLYYVETDTLPYTVDMIQPLCNYDFKAFITPYDQSDVYAKEWSDWVLAPSGTLTAVIINARVW